MILRRGFWVLGTRILGNWFWDTISLIGTWIFIWDFVGFWIMESCIFRWVLPNFVCVSLVSFVLCLFLILIWNTLLIVECCCSCNLKKTWNKLWTLTWNIICEYTFSIKLIISNFSNGIGGGGGGGGHLMLFLWPTCDKQLFLWGAIKFWIYIFMDLIIIFF